MDIQLVPRADGVTDYWHGDGSKAAAVVFALLFGGGAFYHIFQLFKYRAWYFIAFVVGAIMMTGGYWLRFISIRNPSELGPYIMQSLLIILPPSLYAATIYMIYGRIVVLVDAAHLSLIRPTRVTKVFVILDVFAFFIQSGGGSMLVDVEKQDMGKKILLLGLFIQLLSFGFFLVVSSVFYFRVSRAKEINIPTYGNYHWTTMLKVLYFAAAFIIIRCIFRIFEFSAGNDSSLRTNEVWAYCLDALPMFAVQTVFNVIHGGMVLPTGAVAKREALSSDSQYEFASRV